MSAENRFTQILFPVWCLIGILLLSGCSDEDGNIIQSAFFGGKLNDTTGSQTQSGKNIVYSRYTVYSDNNGDGIINKGESIALKVYLKNTGSSDANSVTATMTTTSLYISSLAPTSAISFGTISAGSESNYYGNYYSSEYSWSFAVSSSTPTGTQIPFTLNITDGQGNTWTQSFTVTVQATGANIQYSRNVVYSDNNGDGIINKGESIALKVYLKNTGSSDANSVTATMTTTSLYISSLAPTSAISFGTISAGSESNYYGNYYSSEYSWSFAVSSSTPTGTQIPFTLNITDGQGNTWTQSFTVTVQATGANIQYSRNVVYSDNNGDGIINKGESIALKVYLKNTGSSDANSVTATMTTTSSYISSLAPTSAISFGTISAGSESNYYGNYYSSEYSWSFAVSSSTPTGTSITFNLAISDGQSNTWTSSFAIIVQ